MSENNDYVILQYDKVIAGTKDAVLLGFCDGDVWFPRSISTVEFEQNEVSVPLWFVEEKELEAFII